MSLLTSHGSVLDPPKPTPRREQEAIKHIVATIFSAQDALRDLAPEQRWAGMGNLLGDYGEYIALANYNLKKAPSGAGSLRCRYCRWFEGLDQGEPLIFDNKVSEATRIYSWC